MTRKFVDHELEASALGSILRARGGKDHVLPTLAAEDFDHPQHRAVFEAMARLHGIRARADARAVATEAAKGGLDTTGALSRLIETVATPANAEHYATQLRSLSALRMVAELDVKGIATGADDGTSAVTEVRRLLDAIDKRGTSRRLHTGNDLATRAMTRLEQAMDTKGALRGLPTGFVDLDRALGGLRPGALYILAARPGMGKTALAVNILSHVTVKQGLRSFMASLEMPADELADRILASEARMNSEAVSAGIVQEHEWIKVQRVLSNLSGSAMLVDDRSSTPIAEIAATARALHADKPLSLVVVDYLQLARGSIRAKSPREQEVAEVAEGLKGIAKDLGVPVLALAQLNRGVEQREEKVPLLSDLRESGQIEQAADVVLMLWRKGYYDEDAEQTEAEIVIRKNRHGRLGSLKLRWSAELVRFDSAGFDP